MTKCCHDNIQRGDFFKNRDLGTNFYEWDKVIFVKRNLQKNLPRKESNRMKVKVNKQQALLFLGGSAMVLTSAAQAQATTVHADTKNKTTKVVKDDKKDTQHTTTKTDKDGKTKETTQADGFTLVTVKDGDTTWDIAQKYDTTVQQIVKDNNLSDGGNLIHINDVLKVRADDGTDKSQVTSQAGQDNSQTQVQSNATAPASGSANSTAQTGSTGYQANTASTSYQAPQQSTTNYQSSASTQSYASQATQTAQQAPAKTTSYQSNATGSEKAAKEWIASRESGGSYTARNPSSGAYGRYQLLPGYLKGDYSPANQERVADNYVKGRYGSWQAAKSFWMAHNWY